MQCLDQVRTGFPLLTGIRSPYKTAQCWDFATPIPCFATQIREVWFPLFNPSLLKDHVNPRPALSIREPKCDIESGPYYYKMKEKIKIVYLNRQK